MATTIESTADIIWSCARIRVHICDACACLYGCAWPRPAALLFTVLSWHNYSGVPLQAWGLFIKRSQGTGRRGLKTHNAICSVSFFCFMFGRRCLSLLIYSILSFAPICLLSLLCPLSPFFCVSLLQGDCRTREEALILGVELCDNGFMHHGTALFAARDFDRGNQMFFILLLKSRGILSLAG